MRLYELLFPKDCICCGKILSLTPIRKGFCKTNLCRICYRLLEEENQRLIHQKIKCDKNLPEIILNHYYLFLNLGLKKSLLRRAKLTPSLRTLKLLFKISKNDLLQLKENFSEIDLVVPIPGHFSSLMKRGFSPAGEFSFWVKQELKCAQSSTALKFKKHTAKQAMLKKKQRFANLADAFSANKSVRNKHILLVDDVLTTGATILSAKNCLLDSGAASVKSLSLSLSPLTLN